MLMTDAELIVASRRDPRLFRQLYDRLADDLLAYFYRRTRDAEVAMDLLAETFAVAFERRAHFEDRAGRAPPGSTASPPRSSRAGIAARRWSCARCGALE